MEKYEYMEFNLNTDDKLKKLNELGEQGWEIVEQKDNGIALLKRKKILKENKELLCG